MDIGYKTDKSFEGSTNAVYTFPFLLNVE